MTMRVDRGKAAVAFAMTVVALGAFLRIAGINLIWTLIDQTRDLTKAFAIVAGREFPLLGPEVGGSGFCLGPLYYYLLAIPAFVTRSPICVFLFAALVNAAALYVFFRAVRRWLGAEVAVFALIPYAFSTLWIIRSQLLGNPTLIPLFVILFWWSLTELAIEKRVSAFPWVCALMVVLVQLHLSTAVFIPMALIVVIIFRAPLEKKWCIKGCAVASVLALPYLYHECLHGFANTRGLLGFIFGFLTRGEAGVRGGIVADLRAGFTAAPKLLSELVPDRESWYNVFLSEHILAAGGVAVAVVRIIVCLMRRKITREAQMYTVLLIWLGCMIVATVGKKGVFKLYYLDAAYPAPFVFLGVFLATLWRAGGISRTWGTNAIDAYRGDLSPRDTMGEWAVRESRGCRFEAVTGWAVILYLAVLAVMNIDVLNRFRCETARRGVAELPGYRLNIRRMQTWGKVSDPYCSVMPLCYRRELAYHFVAHEGLSYGECRRRLHGLYAACFLEDKGFWIGWFDGECTTRGGAADKHYIIGAPDARLLPSSAAESNSRVGPFTVVAFSPALHAVSWEVKDLDGARLGAIDIPTGAFGMKLPSASPFYRYWEPGFRSRKRAVVIEGEVQSGPVNGPAAVSITVRSGNPVRVKDVLFDGRPLALRGEGHLRLHTLVSTYSYRLELLDEAGTHSMRFTLASRAPLSCDVDVYGYPCLPPAAGHVQ
jgi:hypothetical protein